MVNQSPGIDGTVTVFGSSGIISPSARLIFVAFSARLILCFSRSSSHLLLIFILLPLFHLLCKPTHSFAGVTSSNHTLHSFHPPYTHSSRTDDLRKTQNGLCCQDLLAGVRSLRLRQTCCAQLPSGRPCSDFPYQLPSRICL